MRETNLKERRDIVTTLIVAGALAIAVIVGSVVRVLQTFTPEGVAVGVPFNGVPADFAPAPGLPAVTVRVTAGDLVADGVNVISVASLGVSIVLGALTWLAVIACFALLALRFLKGRFFDRGNPRLLDVAAWGMFGGAVVTYLFETLGRNGVLSAAGIGDYYPSSWALTAPFVPVWIAGLVLGLISHAFRRGIRLQRDTDGLV